jgi:hypothetical protein
MLHYASSALFNFSISRRFFISKSSELAQLSKFLMDFFLLFLQVNISNTWTLPQPGFNVFYRHFRDKISWFEADAVCQFHHANLVTGNYADKAFYGFLWPRTMRNSRTPETFNWLVALVHRILSTLWLRIKMSLRWKLLLDHLLHPALV